MSLTSHIPDTFEYVLPTGQLYDRGVGLAPLGYTPLGYNGTLSLDWVDEDADLHTFPIQLNIYKPDAGYHGQINVITDDGVNHPDHWTHVAGGLQLTTTQLRSMPGGGVLTQTLYVPGFSVFSARFTTHGEFITVLRHAHALMLDPQDAAIQAALLGLPPN